MSEGTTRQLTLDEIPGELAICRLPADSELPTWAAGPFISLSRTPDELSVVCAATAVPTDVESERDWVCFKLAGPFAFDEIGVLAAIAGPLAEAQIGIFVVSTFDTDYVLVKAASSAETRAVLESAGHTVRPVANERTS